MKCLSIGQRCQKAPWLVQAQHEATAVSCSNVRRGAACSLNAKEHRIRMERRAEYARAEYWHIRHLHAQGFATDRELAAYDSKRLMALSDLASAASDPNS